VPAIVSDLYLESAESHLDAMPWNASV
jgi:hypothetical protein